ncbi:MAG: dTDP-4-dehydrorhamnose reductase [Armatimonadetes bacterium]|nr:dTDP-4-dehydrorhamnose reductase [Armatimonadota bacterium]
MKILITGAGGMLGSDLCSVLGDRAVPRTRAEMDVTVLRACREAIREAGPSLVVHCGAFTDVDACETRPGMAFEVNALGTANLALVCSLLEIPLLYVSTDYVFNGKKSAPYVESDPPHPLGAYGKSKWAGEDFIRKHLSRYCIVRTSWLFGRNGKNFVRSILRQAREREHTGEPLRVVDDQVGSPTYTLDLAGAILSLAKRQRVGTYHVTNQGTCSWYRFACEILKDAGISVPVVPIHSSDLGRPAPRPANSVLDNRLWRALGFLPLRPYRHALRAYLKEICEKEASIV